MRKTIIILTFLGLLSSCSPKIRSILKYQKEGNEFVLRNITEFDKNGNKVISKGVGNLRSNRITTIEYKNNRRIFEKSCDYFEKQDTCVIRDFSKFEFDKKMGIEKQTLYEPDSAVRFIREIKRLKNMEIKKTYTWEFSPTKTPKVENALILTDTTFFNKKNRKTKVIHYSSSFKEPWIEVFKYSKNEYTRQTIGTARDTIIKFKITDLQKMAEKKKIKYKFYNSEKYKYGIEYY